MTTATRDDARVVDQDVKAADVFRYRPADALPILLARDIEPREPGLMTDRAKLVGECGTFVIAYVADHDACTALEANSDSTKSVRAARDQDYLAAKTRSSDRFVQRVHSASCLISAYRSDLPSKPMPGSSGIVM